MTETIYNMYYEKCFCKVGYIRDDVSMKCVQDCRRLKYLATSSVSSTEDGYKSKEAAASPRFIRSQEDRLPILVREVGWRL